METRLLHRAFFLGLLTLATLFWMVPANAQLSPTQSGAQGVPQDNDTTRGELASFDRFLDSHPEIAEQLRRDPSLVRNERFVNEHAALQEYLQQHPGVREEITEDPGRFMRQERRFDRREDMRGRDRDNDRRDNDTTRWELTSFDSFADSHPEIAEQLRKDPSLVNNQEFVASHPELQEYLQHHPNVREEITENPNRFMRQEQRFDRREEMRENDPNRWELVTFDQFADSHPEIAEQLRKDPSLVNNQEFVAKHPALQEYLQQHPNVREEITENPNRFMRQEQAFDRREDNRDHDGLEAAHFGQFLGSHSRIAQELSRNPGLANDEEFRKNHPELQQYLKEHPGVQEALKQNPQMFMKSAQQVNGSPVPKTSTIAPSPKQ